MSELKRVTTVPSLPHRPAEMHKGQAGRVVIIAGSRGMSGAGVLCGLGALRGGAGLVRAATSRSNQPIVAISEPALLTAVLAEDDAGLITFEPGELAPLHDEADVIACGPGLGRSAALGDALIAQVLCFGGPLVLDADGLNNLATTVGLNALRTRRQPTVITPHPGEMKRLCRAAGLATDFGADDDSRVAAAAALAERLAVTVLLKGHRTVIVDGTSLFINETGNPGMATGGMGDVLTGLIAALVGQGLDAFAAARLGVWAHGTAADVVRRQVGGCGYLAREVADALPGVLSRPHVDGFRPGGMG
jgi:ADP-dependent NAD(P)H-hydrate dehydratase